jgi:hypothetical protein
LEEVLEKEITPEQIMRVGLGFWESKTLLSAIELGLFTELSKGPATLQTIQDRLRLHPRASRDFLDALVALGMLQRTGNEYSNTPETDFFLDRSKPTYIGGILEMCNERLYAFWNNLTEGLRTGEPQNEAKTGGNLFDMIYNDDQGLRQFLSAMTGLSLGVGKALAKKFPWKEYRNFVDVGAAQGGVPVQIALEHSHLTGINFDLPVVGPVFNEYVASFNLSDRLRFQGGDFFKDSLPATDVVIMGHILHDWNLEEKQTLVKKAYDALPSGGAFIVFEALIDDDRRTNAFGLLMSLNMLVETRGGFDYTGADCSSWMKAAGFRSTRVEHLVGPDSMVVGIK